jgi:hypothetical protein
MNLIDSYGRTEIIKAYVLREFLVKDISELDINDVLIFFGLADQDFLHRNLEVKNSIASFIDKNEEIAYLQEIYDLSRSYKRQEQTNGIYLEIVSVYQKKLNGPVNIETFGKVKPYLQLKNLILLGDISLKKDGFVIFDDKQYKTLIEKVVNDYKSDCKNQLDEILKSL